MKSGLEDRNNSLLGPRELGEGVNVSMKSGLEDRNNLDRGLRQGPCCSGLNEVRPGRPEQSDPRPA